MVCLPDSKNTFNMNLDGWVSLSLASVQSFGQKRCTKKRLSMFLYYTDFDTLLNVSNSIKTAFTCKSVWSNLYEINVYILSI